MLFLFGTKNNGRIRVTQNKLKGIKAETQRHKRA